MHATDSGSAKILAFKSMVFSCATVWRYSTQRKPSHASHAFTNLDTFGQQQEQRKQLKLKTHSLSFLPYLLLPMAVSTMNRRVSPITTSSRTVSSELTSTSKTVDSVEQNIQKMKTNLIKYARNNDRRMVLRSLQEVKTLNCLSLDVAQNADGPLFDLEKEVAEVNLVLNGVEIRGVSLYNVPGVKDPVTSGVKNSCIPLLKALCRELCEREDVKTSSRELYEKVIVHLAKSTSSADPYFRLNSLLGSPDLLVMHMDKETNENKDDEMSKSVATELNLYAANGDIHMTLSQTYNFGLLRKADVKSNRPWVMIHGVVSERGNLTTNNSVRQLKVVLPKIF
jgi:hypothetical protein